MQQRIGFFCRCLIVAFVLLWVATLLHSLSHGPWVELLLEVVFICGQLQQQSYCLLAGCLSILRQHQKSWTKRGPARIFVRFDPAKVFIFSVSIIERGGVKDT